MKLTAEEMLAHVAEILLEYIKELKDIDENSFDQFSFGEKTAFVECLEILQQYERADKIGLDFDIEKKYPL